MSREILKRSKESGIWEAISNKDGKPQKRFLVKVYRWTPNDKIKKPGQKGYAPNLEQARQLKKRLEAALEKRIENRSRFSFRSFYENIHKAEIESTHSVRSAYNLKAAYEGKITPYFGSKYIDEITVAEINDFLHIHLNNLEVSTKKNYRKHLSAFFKSAISRKIITSNPVAEAKQFKDAKSRQETFLTPEQLKTLLAFVIQNKHEWMYHYSISALCGVRCNELAALVFSDLRLDTNLIYIHRTFDRRTGFKNYTKNFDKRFVPLNPVLKELLLERKEREGLSDSDFLVPQLRRWLTGEQGKVLQDVLSLLGLPRCRYYDLRASFAVAYVLETKDVLKCCEILGHHNISMTSRYLRKLGVGLTGATDCLNNLFDEKTIESIKNKI